MGVGATNIGERIAASFGYLNGVQPNFQIALDVPKGGLLFALPALLACGLLRYTKKYFQLPTGYYAIESIFVLLAFMALSRVTCIEQLRYYAPGEWGKLLGLDRIPEVRTLRQKIKLLCEQHSPEKWSAELCQDWIGESDNEGGFLFYIDGHVRVYYGKQTKLPRHYVSRERLCLRATVDYWVNANDGQPFLLVNKSIDPGLIQVMENDIVPQLKKTVPMLTEEKSTHQFTLIFDREGYSPDFLARMKEQNIACISYHKYPKAEWANIEFSEHTIQLAFNANTTANLAERGTRLNNGLWVREIRKLSNRGHQTSVIATDYTSDLIYIAARMFDRWSQENFFKYMRKHYNIDSLLDYDLTNIPDATKIVNPKYRKLDTQIRSKNSLLSNRLSKFGALKLTEEISVESVEEYQKNKALLQEEIEQLQTEISDLKKERKSINKHITFSELEEEERFKQLNSNNKHFIDTIKMIAYRAETAMSNLLQEHMSRSDDSRSLLRALYNTEVDILPDQKTKTLTIKLHHLANHHSSQAIEKLCAELNATETEFPGTDLRLVYKMVSPQNPRDQEV